MGEGSSALVWFNAPGFRVIDIDDAEIDVVSIETEPGRGRLPELRGDRQAQGPSVGDGARHAGGGSAGDDPLAQADLRVRRGAVSAADLD